ncbi:MAG: tripartite tricarboxylate transporter TctB family protein [Gemmobacter sp.]
MTGHAAPERRPDGAAFVIAVGLALFGSVLLWDASGIVDKGGYAGVGPAAMPKFVGAGLLVLAALTAISGLRGDDGPVPRQEVAPILWIIAGMLAIVFLVHPLGYTIASGILFACTAFAFGKRNLALTLPVGLVFAFAVYAVFDQVLKLNLPAGIPEKLVFGG